MIFFHLAMVLCELVEFHEHYYDYLPAEGQLWLTELKVKVKQRGVRDLRNKAIGHILDKKTLLSSSLRRLCPLPWALPDRRTAMKKPR